MRPLKRFGFLCVAFVTLTATLLAIDADQDGLDDSVENNTGIYVSQTDTGTSPTNPDSDGDGAGDWYEVAASLTDPTNAGSKPNVPYPLPAPDASTGATNKPVKVFILSGQSNMEGQGNVTPLGTPGTLETITKDEFKFPNLLDGANWSSRNDVLYRGVVSAIKNQPLTAGQGTTPNAITAIGPELGFGHVMGYFYDEPVLILKSAEGGKSLGGEFLPPGSVQYDYTTKTYPGFGQSPISWITGSTPVADPLFYAGMQFDKCFRDEADWAPAGAALPATFNVTNVLDNFATEYPQWAAQGFEIAGFAWFQGWNDGLSYTGQYAYRYEQNMAQFIRQLRAYYENRYPEKIKAKAPFAIATAGFDGFSPQIATRKAVFDAQINVADPTLYPEFAGNVKTMDTRSYWRDKTISPVPNGNQGFHYNRNAETYMLVGDALGRAMIDLTSPSTPGTTPVGDAIAVILATDFTDRTVLDASATVTDYTLNGVANPGPLAAVRLSGGTGAINLFNTTTAQGYFAPTQNPAHWQLYIPLVVGSTPIELENIEIKFQSFSNAGALKTQTTVGDDASDHYATVSVIDNSQTSLRSEQIAASVPGTRATWTGTFTAASGLALQADTSYTLRVVISGLNTTTAAASGNNVGLDAIRILSITSTEPFAAWQNQHFPGVSDAAVISENADPDRDGDTNLVEYALNTDPNDPTKRTSLKPELAASTLSLLYTQVAAATDITYVVEWSTDLQSWSDSGVTQTTDPAPPADPNFPVISAEVTRATDSIKFLRLKINKGL